MLRCAQRYALKCEQFLHFFMSEDLDFVFLCLFGLDLAFYEFYVSFFWLPLGISDICRVQMCTDIMGPTQNSSDNLNVSGFVNIIDIT